MPCYILFLLRFTRMDPKIFCIQIKIDEYIVRDKNIICNQRKWINKKCALNVNAVPRSKMKNHPGGQKRVFSLSHAISNSRKSVCTSSAHFSLSLSLSYILFSLFHPSFCKRLLSSFFRERREKTKRPVGWSAFLATTSPTWRKLNR